MDCSTWARVCPFPMAATATTGCASRPPEKGFALPPTYGATSGGGLMRLFLEKGTKNMIELRHLGPVYYETAPKEDAVRDLICHGPRSVYECLAEKIEGNWPE